MNNKSFQQKIIKEPQRLQSVVAKIRHSGKSIVTYNGSFDLFHEGHLYSIIEAKKQGDVLFILLNSDLSINKYKGGKRPIINERSRAALLAGLPMIDYIYVFNELTPVETLELIKPDRHCKGKEWGNNCIERFGVEKNGGKIVNLKTWHTDTSSSTIIKTILKKEKIKENRAVFFDRDGTINANNPPYLHKKEDFVFNKGILDTLKKLSKLKYKIFIITNQSGIGRGYFSYKEYQNLTRWLLDKLRRLNIKITKIYTCPHAPDKGCACRKPGIKFILEAGKKYNLNLSKSWLVGDDAKDIICGRMTNMKTIKIGGRMPSNLKIAPHYYAKDANEIYKIISEKK